MTVAARPWAAHAAAAASAWQRHYDVQPDADETGMFRYRHPFAEVPGQPFHYWWMAHAMDALLDAFERDGDAAHLDRARVLVEAVRRQNGGGITNDFYDDMAWMALACLRAHGLCPVQDWGFKAVALELWADIQTGWNDHCGGGIAWRKPQPDYKNAPANAPVAILAARLYTRFGDGRDLEWAQRIWAWLEANLIDPESHIVWDGMNREGDGRVDRDWLFTYCQGVTVGAALELHRATGEGRLLECARSVAHAARARWPLLPEEGEGDGGLFKGILVRYFAEWLLASRDEAVLAWLRDNARTALERGVDDGTGLAGRDWRHPPAYPLDLSAALSGAMLFEAMAKLERHGVFEKHGASGQHETPAQPPGSGIL